MGRGMGARGKDVVPGKGSATPDTICLRCGERGHYARDCPHAQATRKRDVGDTTELAENMVASATDDRDTAMIADTRKQCPHIAIYDTGASSFIVG